MLAKEKESFGPVEADDQCNHCSTSRVYSLTPAALPVSSVPGFLNKNLGRTVNPPDIRPVGLGGRP